MDTQIIFKNHLQTFLAPKEVPKIRLWNRAIETGLNCPILQPYFGYFPRGYQILEVIFISDLSVHFVIWNNFSKRKWWISPLCKGPPYGLSTKMGWKNISYYQKSNLMSQNGQISMIIFTKKIIWLYGKNSHNGHLE